MTLPAELRRRFNISSGQRLRVCANDGAIVVEPVVDVAKVRSWNRRHLKSKFTSSQLKAMAEKYNSGEGFTSYVEKKYGKS